MSQFTQIGYLKKSFGTDGMIRYSLIDSFNIELENGHFIFLDLKGSMVPFMIKNLDLQKSTLKLEWINTLEQANEIAQRPIYLSDKELPSTTAVLVNDNFNGLDLFDSDQNLIGYISEVREYPGQLMMIVEMGSKEHLIPFHEDWVINRTETKMVYQIPDGILDI